ncbi:MAG: hypothetical protein KC464_06575, partial [Myxococcales bacterium]|nr:hypothetical protein [Myxococcales bacterium]
MQRRTVGLLLAGVGATLILVSVLSRTWLVGARGEAPVRVGLTRAESCKPGHDDAGRPETRCETASVATLLREGTPRRDYDDAYAALRGDADDDAPRGRPKTFTRLGQITFYGGIGVAALLVLLVVTIVTRGREPGPRALGLTLAVACGALAATGAA